MIVSARQSDNGVAEGFEERIGIAAAEVVRRIEAELGWTSLDS